MDETEKYKQRLEAIAEKRRLQEEQDKARREKEDERLRQQQLKRKSLRDQWLMEGSPLSPLSPNTQKTFSSLWGEQDQDMEKHPEKLQSEDQQVTVQRNCEMEAVKMAETQAANGQSFLENGDSTALRVETPGDKVELNQSPPQGEAAVVLTNGGGSGGENGEASGQNEMSPVGNTEDASRAEMELESSSSTAASSQVSNANMNEEEEGADGTLVMRAECVYITDEGDDVSGDLCSLKDQQEFVQKPEEGQGILALLEQDVKTEASPDSENGEAAAPAVKQQPPYDDRGDMKGGTEQSSNPDEEKEAKGHDEKREDPDGPQPESFTRAPDSATPALVPIYAEAPSSVLISEAEAESKDEAAAAVPKEAEEALKVEEPTCKLGQFQEVLLADPQESRSVEAEPGEQEGLLQKVPASNLSVEPTGSNSLGSFETQSPNSTTQAEKSVTPKRKTCQCCSLM